VAVCGLASSFSFIATSVSPASIITFVQRCPIDQSQTQVAQTQMSPSHLVNNHISWIG
jgi:hypothetical protein